jgi:hypothetical protein
MVAKYTLTRIERDDLSLAIDIDINDDGSLHIMDWSMGRAADEMFGAGRDVEHWIDIDAESVRELVCRLTGSVSSNPGIQLAGILVGKFAGQSSALSSIIDLCNNEGIAYKEGHWS